MVKSPLVTVVIPTYSRPTYLKRCIDSVLNQTYKNIEIIVVDDNNADTKARKETEAVMKKYFIQKNVMYLQHEMNKNGAAARNTGWKASQGKYITFLDDDDEITVDKIEKQVKCLEQLDMTWGACYAGYKLIKENGANQISKEKRSGNCYLNALMRTMFMGSGSNLFLRRDVVDKLHGYDESFQRNQDIEFLVRVCEKYKIAYIDEVLLIIHQEGERKKYSFEYIEKVTLHYLEKFMERINALDNKNRKRVLAVISLERFRTALYAKRYKDGIKILINNKVSFVYIIRYIKYLIQRCITHTSYGFDGR